jgi:hypothetical protein
MPLDRLFDVLFDNYFDERVKRPWAEEGNNAKRAAEATVQDIRAFVAANLEPHMLSRGIETITEIHGVEQVDLQRVTTPAPDPNNPDRTVTIAIGVAARCIVTVETPSDMLHGFLTGEYSGRTITTRERRTWSGGVEATADVRNRQFSNLRFVRLVSSDQLDDMAKGRTAESRTT